jgi:hypothetical protein
VPVRIQDVEKGLQLLLASQVRCFRDGDVLAVDTPYVLQDGHLLRAYIDASNPLQLFVSDGGFIQRQMETFSRSSAMLRERRIDVQQIANELSLQYEEEFSFTETDLDKALARMSTLARAVDRALGVLSGKPPRRRLDARSRLRDQLIDSGLSVTQRARPEMPNGMRPVIVDQLVRRNGHQAAVEILTAKTDGGAAISVDRAIANFHVLEHYAYEGKLIAVYDVESPASSRQLLDKIEAGKPKSALLLPNDTAADAIKQHLAA